VRDRTDVSDMNHADNDMSFRPRWYLSERVDVCVLGYREIVKKAGLIVRSPFLFFGGRKPEVGNSSEDRIIDGRGLFLARNRAVFS
jgi:hypothetical protein